jgi:hypothetical protein
MSSYYADMAGGVNTSGAPVDSGDYGYDAERRRHCHVYADVDWSSWRAETRPAAQKAAPALPKPAAPKPAVKPVPAPVKQAPKPAVAQKAVSPVKKSYARAIPGGQRGAMRPSPAPETKPAPAPKAPDFSDLPDDNDPDGGVFESVAAPAPVAIQTAARAQAVPAAQTTAAAPAHPAPERVDFSTLQWTPVAETLAGPSKRAPKKTASVQLPERVAGVDLTDEPAEDDPGYDKWLDGKMDLVRRTQELAPPVGMNLIAEEEETGRWVAWVEHHREESSCWCESRDEAIKGAAESAGGIAVGHCARVMLSWWEGAEKQRRCIMWTPEEGELGAPKPEPVAAVPAPVEEPVQASAEEAPAEEPAAEVVQLAPGFYTVAQQLYAGADSGNIGLMEGVVAHAAKAQLASALASAAERGQMESVRWLLDHGADPNYFFALPLTRAIDAGHREIVRLLVLRGADTDAPGMGLQRQYALKRFLRHEPKPAPPVPKHPALTLPKHLFRLAARLEGMDSFQFPDNAWVDDCHDALLFGMEACMDGYRVVWAHPMAATPEARRQGIRFDLCVKAGARDRVIVVEADGYERVWELREKAQVREVAS